MLKYTSKLSLIPFPYTTSFGLATLLRFVPVTDILHPPLQMHPYLTRLFKIKIKIKIV